jgi:Gram-negative porin
MIQSTRVRVTVAALLTTLAMPAAAQLKYENSSGGSALFYGQFDPAFVNFDDGVSSTGELVDNTNSNSRVGFWLRGQTGGNELSFNFETALGLRPADGLSQTVTPKGVNWQRTSIRKVDFSLNTERAGRFSLGQGSMASDGMSETDMSGTTLVTYSSIGDTAGGFQFRTTAGALSGITVGGAFSNFDGGRLGRIRYDSPEFSGFKVSASYGENILTPGSNRDTTDIALRYSGEVGGAKMEGAVGYARTDPGTGAASFNDTAGSFSVLLDSGFNFTLAAGSRQGGGDFGYGKLGYKSDWFSVGTTALSIDYYNGSDQTSAGSDSKTYGVGAVQKFDNANVEAYLGYRSYELTETAASYRDASSVIFGARWKF